MLATETQTEEKRAELESLQKRLRIERNNYAKLRIMDFLAGQVAGSQYAYRADPTEDNKARYQDEMDQFYKFENRFKAEERKLGRQILDLQRSLAPTEKLKRRLEPVCA